MSSGMDFLKTCNTNAQAIGDFDAVAYQAFSIKRDTASPSTKLQDRDTSEDLLAIEAHFRRDGHLVVQDAAKSLLWSFRATTADRASQKPAAVPVLEGYIFEALQSGVMRASELVRPPNRALNQSVNSPSSPATFKGPTMPNQRPNQSTNPAGQAAEQQPQHDIVMIYELFMSAIVALLSYALVRDHDVIALNYRTFLLMDFQNEVDPGNQKHKKLFWLANLGAYWTSSGTVVITLFSTPRQDIHCLDEIKDRKEQIESVGKCVRCAPSGILAKLVGFEHPPDLGTENANPQTQRKRPKLQPAERGVEHWKSAVRRWLAWKGYSLSDLDETEVWVKIKLSSVVKSQVGASSSAHPTEVLWPAALCFLYEPDPTARMPQKDISSLPEQPIDWFEGPGSSGFQDPLDKAQEWFLGKVERDMAFEARRKAQQSEEDAINNPKEENTGLYPSSPLYSRTGTYGDLQTASGVYPTPPDGVGPTASNSANPPIPGTAAASERILAAGGNNPTINLSAPDSGPVDTRQQSGTSPDLPMSFDQFDTHNQNDDLFEDMDEDVMDGIGVTDADFEFFNAPDGEDFDMLDNGPPPGAKEDPEPAHKVKEDPSEQQLDMESSMKQPDGVDTRLENTTEVDTTTKAEEELSRGEVKLNHIDQAPPPNPSSQGVVETTPRTPTPSPPLNPVIVRQKLLPSPRDKQAPKTPRQQQPNSTRKGSVFEPVSFSHKISLTDAKYTEGRFSLPHGKTKGKQDVWDRSSKQPIAKLHLPLLTRLQISSGVPSDHPGNDRALLDVDDDDLTDSSSDVSSPAGEEADAESVCPEPLSAGIMVPGKRKFPIDGNATPLSTVSFAESAVAEGHDSTGLQTSNECLDWFEPSSWDWPLASLPCPSEIPVLAPRNDLPSFSPVTSPMPNTPTSQPDTSVDHTENKSSLSGKDSISIAQIVTAQIISTTLDLLNEDTPPSRAADLVSIRDGWGRTFVQGKLRNVVRSLFPKATDCTVSALASVQDVFPDVPQQNKGPPRPPQRRVNPQADKTASPGVTIYSIPPPYIRVRRQDLLWDLLPPALSFWEPLSLCPSSATKNVVPFCVYPHSDSLRPWLESFLVNVQIAYESCRLGSHARVDSVPEFEGGLVPCKVSNLSSSKSAFKALRDTCVQLGKSLASKHVQLQSNDENLRIDAFVIYMIDPFQSPSSVWELCSAFWSLFHAYGQGPQGRQDVSPKPDLVLQIIPSKYIASFDKPVVLDTSTYMSLAREVFDRCPPSAPSEEKTPLSIYSAPAFQLEETLPRTLQFKLVSEPPVDLLRENSYMHVCYALSLDGGWVTAAWTDSWGKSQAVVSYNIGTRSFAEVAKEIWQTTIDILQSRRVNWRVCLARAGVMEREELETWIYLASCPTKLNLFIFLLAVDPTPNIRLIPTQLTGPITNPSTSQLPTNTPGSTPQAGVSPEQPGLTPGATPSENPNDPSSDPDARLIDVTDETWGVILAHRLHNTNSTVEFRPAVISGLLVKRGESISTASSSYQIPDRERGPLVLGVNMLWLSAVNSTRAATSPFPPSSSAEGVSPGGGGAGGQAPVERGPTVMWSTTLQTRTPVEHLLKDILSQYRALGLLAKLKGMRGTRHGIVPWHVAAALRGAEGVNRCASSAL